MLPRICAIPVTPQPSGRNASVTQTISNSLSAPPLLQMGRAVRKTSHAVHGQSQSSASGAVLRLQAEHTHISSRCTCTIPMHEQVQRLRMVTVVLTMPVIRKSATTRPQMCFRCRPEGGNLRFSWLQRDEVKIHCLGVWLHSIAAE